MWVSGLCCVYRCLVCVGKFFIDGSEYFSVLADAIEGAATTVLIADWFLTPQLFLKRDEFPPQQRYRLGTCSSMLCYVM